MKLIIQIFAISIGTYILQLFLPWYSIAVIPFFMGFLVARKGIAAFFAGFLGIGLLWGLLAWLIHWKSSGILSEKVADLLQTGSAGLLILLTAALGGLAGGLWALSGYAVRSLFKAKKRQSPRYDLS